MGNKNNNMFLAVVGVATLVVAMIGATFAYFTASANSAENAIDLSSYDFAVTLDDIEVVEPVDYDTLGGIIPLEEDKLLYALNTGNKSNTPCVDDNGHLVCVLYKATLTNTSVNPAHLTLTAKTTSNVKGSAKNATPFKDLTILALDEEDGAFVARDQAKTLLEAEGTAVDFGGTITVPGVGEGGELVHYFVVYLNEPNEDTDQSNQMGAKYTGELIYTSTTGSDRLSGTFGLMPTTNE